MALRSNVLLISILSASSVLGSSHGYAQKLDVDKLFGAFIGGASGELAPDPGRRPFNPNNGERSAMPRPEPRQTERGGAAYPYSVAGLRLGEQPRSLDEYRCEPSVIMDEAFWCEKSAQNASANGEGMVSDKILVSDRQGVRYASRFVDPAFFQPGEVQSEVARLRARFQDQGRMTVYGATGGNPSAVIATWGSVNLRQLTPAEMDAVHNKTFKARGLYIDYMNDPPASAKRGMPIYQMSGGPGFFWVSNFDIKGVGSLRFGMIDVNYGASPDGLTLQAAAEQGNLGAAPQGGQPIAPRMVAKAPVAPPSPSEFADATLRGGQPVAPVMATTAPAAPPPPSDFASQPGASAAVSLASNATPGAEAAPDAVKMVDVTGYGETVDAARSDAARQAVQQVAGVYVDNRRRVDENVTDQKVTTVVNEKVLSYTNAYVTHLNFSDVANSNGLFSIHAHVSVAVAPLIKTLNDNKIPTVAFDTNSAVATATTAAEEKADAQKVYLDLLDRVSGLVTVSVGAPKPRPDLPASPDHIWLQIPLTFFANKGAIEEWRKKITLIAQSTTQVDVASWTVKPQAVPHCEIPEISSFLTLDRTRKSELDRASIPGTFGVEVCFADSEMPGGLSSTCYRRDFNYNHNYFNPYQCQNDSACPALVSKAGSVRINIELLAKDGSVAYSAPFPLSNFPQIDVSKSRVEPESTSSSGFLNFCAGRHDLFYSYAASGGSGPDLLLIPLAGSRLDSYFDVQIPSEKVGSIASVRAQIVGH